MCNFLQIWYIYSIFHALFCYSIETFGPIPMIYVKYAKYSEKHGKSFNIVNLLKDLPCFSEYLAYFTYITRIGPNVSILYCNYVLYFKMFHINLQNLLLCFTMFSELFREIWHIRCLQMFGWF